MNSPIVEAQDPVTLVGGGEIGPGDLALALARAPRLVAADGGAHPALIEGHLPEAVIGDFDSFVPRDRGAIPSDRLFPIREQDSTDFDKALRHILSPLVLAVGFLGARVDHQLAVFNALVRHADRPCVLIGAHEILFHAPPVLTLSPEPGSTVSLFPLRPVRAMSQGLEWPVDGIEFSPDGRVGTSNRALGEMRLEVEGPGMLVMLPRTELDRVMQAHLTPGRATWPARAG